MRQQQENNKIISAAGIHYIRLFSLMFQCKRNGSLVRFVAVGSQMHFEFILWIRHAKRVRILYEILLQNLNLHSYFVFINICFQINLFVI